MRKLLNCFLLLTLSLQGVRAQSAPADDLRDRFVQYQLHNLQEKLFVHTDKTFYLAGEIIWFKIYNVDESFHKPAAFSKLAYVEIINEEQKPVMQAKIGLQEGRGDGSFIIPSPLASGNYILRAYTSRMKNFGAGYYFEQPISIVNTLKQPALKTVETKERYQLEFFPEGGNLVKGIESVVGFRITDQFGNAVDASGYLVAGKSDTLTRLQTLRFGMGSFTLLPQNEQSYHAVFVINDTSIVQNLPAAYEQGYVMNCREAPGSDIVTVTVSSSRQYNNLPVYLLAHTRHLVKQVLTAAVSNGKAVFQLSKSRLGDGVSHITIFNQDRQPLCERLYFKRPAHTLLITAKTDKPGYESRNKINVAVQAEGQPGSPLAADMSVAVFMIDSLQPLQYQDIQSWMLLQSELAGVIAAPQYYFTDSSANAAAAMNNLLLTQGWRRFAWADILQRRLPAFEFITEHEGPVINASLTNKVTGLPQKNVLTTLTLPGEHFELRSAVSKPDGTVQFNVNDFYSSNEMILQPVNAADTALKISIINPFSDKFNTRVFPRLYNLNKWKDQLVNRSISAQADNAYQAERKRLSFLQPVTDTNVFYGKPDKQYYLDDYTRFTTMEEVMKEFVTDVRVRKQADGFRFNVVNGVFKDFFERPPLVLIDGLPVSNVNKIMALDPLKIKKIEVLAHKHFLGSLVNEGVVSYSTYQGDLGGYELDANAVVIEYEGLQRQRIFYSPAYETSQQQQSRIPDLRNLLYWSPAVTTGTDGKQQFSFYSSDLKGNYAIIVQGLTAEGLAGSTVNVFSVK